MRKQEAPRGSEMNGNRPETPGKLKEKRHLSRGTFTTSLSEPLRDPAEVFKDYTPTEKTSAEDRLDDENIVHSTGEPIPSQGLAGYVDTKREKMLRTLQPAVPEDPSELRAEISSLENASRRARAKLRKLHEELEKNNGNTDQNWFETAHYITEKERRIMNLYFAQSLDLDTVAYIVKEVPSVIHRIIQSATRKRFLRDGELTKAELPDNNNAPED